MYVNLLHRMADQQDAVIFQNDHDMSNTQNKGLLRKDTNIEERSKIDEYCACVLEESRNNSVTCDIIDQSGVSEFCSQVRKMKMWPSFDHIFKAARRDNKWYLRSQPLKGVNKILFEEQKLINISKVRELIIINLFDVYLNFF